MTQLLASGITVTAVHNHLLRAPARQTSTCTSPERVTR